MLAQRAFAKTAGTHGVLIFASGGCCCCFQVVQKKKSKTGKKNRESDITVTISITLQSVPIHYPCHIHTTYL